MHSHSCDYGKCYFLRVKHISWQSADICALSKISLFIFTSYIVKLKLHFLHKKIRSSHDMFYRKRFSQPEACNFIKEGTLTQVFSCEFCEISKNTFFTEHILATASVMSLVSFFTPWKHLKIKGFLIISGGIEKDQWLKWVNEKSKRKKKEVVFLQNSSGWLRLKNRNT